ncbi:MAG TPA: acyloxyacyl hydrolase [Prolixibacteraceae bacterium]|nr:acyloxyacyl hydrolase [Prolixibacteraceae bacterium]
MHILQNQSLLRIFFYFSLVWVFTVNDVFAEKQDTLKVKKNLIYAGYVQYGKVLATNPYLRQANAPDDKNIEYAALSFQVLKQTAGNQLWEQSYGLPTYGVGIYSARFPDNKGFGTPIALYGIFKAPFKRWNKCSLNYEAGFGFTFNWEAFNPSENNYNISLGATESVFIDLGANLNFELSRHFDLGLGYSFTHFSNGALKSPNFGLNTFSPKVSLEYRINRVNMKESKHAIPAYIKNTTVDFSVFGGAKNVLYKMNDVDTIQKYKGVYYPVYGFTTVLNRQVNYKSKLGVGMCLSYDGSFNSSVFIENGSPESKEGFQGNKLSLSVFPSYELVINKLSMVIQPGFYVLRKHSTNKEPATYQRLGLHYQLNKHLFAGVNLRAYNYHVSDFLEWTLGYQLKISKNNSN